MMKDALREAIEGKKEAWMSELREGVTEQIREELKSVKADKTESPNAAGWVPSSKMLPHYQPPARPEDCGLRLAMGVRAFVAGGKSMHAVPKVIADKYGDKATADYYAKSIETQNLSSGGVFCTDTLLFQEMFPLLRAKNFLIQAGAQVIMSDTDKVTIPGITSGFQTYWTGETRKIRISNIKFGQIKLNARKNAGLLVVSNDWLDEANSDLDAMIRDDMVRACNQALHLGALFGDGTEEQPLGLDHDERVGVIDVGGYPTSDTLSLFMAAMMEKDIDFNPLTNGVVMGSDVYMIFYNMKDSFGQYRYRKEMTENRTPAHPWGTIEGTPVFVYTQIKPRVATGTPTSIYYGMWSELKILMRKAITIDEFNQATIFDDEGNGISAAQNDVTILRVKAKMDSRLRQDGAIQRSNTVHTVPE